MPGRRLVFTVLTAAILAATGCKAATSPAASAVSPSQTPVLRPTERWTPSPTRYGPERTGSLPTCGSDLPPLTPSQRRTTPPPDACLSSVGSPSPACPIAASTVIDGGVTTTLVPPQEVKLPTIGGFGRWGGRRGGPMCFAEFTDRSVLMSNGDRAILIRHTADPLSYAAIVDLARSQGVWGVVSVAVTMVRVQDTTRPDGVTAKISSLDTGSGTASLPTGLDAARVFVGPVSSAPVTVTAYDGSGTPVGTIRLG